MSYHGQHVYSRAHGSSKSYNALLAEECGKFPASKIVERFRKKGVLLGLTAQIVKDVLGVSEWHHTSKAANETPYYDPFDVYLYRGELRAAIKRQREVRANAGEAFEAVIEWLDWPEYKNSRRAQLPTECRSIGMVEDCGALSVRITFAGGRVMTKRKTTHGLCITPVGDADPALVKALRKSAREAKRAHARAVREAKAERGRLIADAQRAVDAIAIGTCRRGYGRNDAWVQKDRILVGIGLTAEAVWVARRPEMESWITAQLADQEAARERRHAAKVAKRRAREEASIQVQREVAP